jgi:hypothetical protein
MIVSKRQGTHPLLHGLFLRRQLHHLHPRPESGPRLAPDPAARPMVQLRPLLIAAAAAAIWRLQRRVDRHHGLIHEVRVGQWGQVGLSFQPLCSGQQDQDQDRDRDQEQHWGKIPRSDTGKHGAARTSFTSS